jgi:hypothetical protein
MAARAFTDASNPSLPEFHEQSHFEVDALRRCSSPDCSALFFQPHI